MKRTITSLLAALALSGFLAGAQAKTEATDSKPSASKATESKPTAMFAMGCFWKTQYVFSKAKGVVDTEVGYSGGKAKDPNYPLVCTGMTGHAETVQLHYDPKVTSYRNLLYVFWNSHDPTTVDRQGPDHGNQYRSAIFYTTPEQKKEADEVKAELEKSHKFARAIVTRIEPAGPFYKAEDYHQNYFVKHGEVCQ
jgi:methionine-S-sulfoxide reductase